MPHARIIKSRYCIIVLSVKVFSRNDSRSEKNVHNYTKTLDFLKHLYNQTQTPEYLTLSIDVVSWAYMVHQDYSDAALTTTRVTYVSLHLTSKALQCPEVAAKA